jgi:hypothetical protein
MIRVVIVAVGPAFARLGELAAESLRRYTGADPVIVREAPAGRPPAAVKLQLLDMFPGDTVLFCDADTRCVRPWDLSPWESFRGFAAVRDLPSRARQQDCDYYHLDPALYVNTGFWFAGPDCVPVFRDAAELMRSPDYRTAFRWEQTALNVALQRSAVAVQLLERRFNAVCAPTFPPPADAVLLHCAGGCLHGPNRVLFEKAILDAATPTP